MQIKTRSVAINAILNGSKTVITILFPLIIFPYVTRILGVDNLGKVSYAQSIITYFTLIAGLGINTYAVREGAKIRENSNELTKFSNQVFTISLLSTLISYVLLCIVLSAVKQFSNYRTIILVLSSSIFFTTLGVEWINSIFEDYLYITIRTLVIQTLHLILVFLIIREPTDYVKYAVLIALSQILIGTINFFHCRKYCKVGLTNRCEFRKHLKPMSVLFANSVAITLYCNSDSTMLGLMTSDYYVGIYAVAVKVFSMVRGLLAALLLVSIPRLSTYIGQDNTTKAKQLVSKITCGMLLLLLPAITGLICLAKPIVLILSGVEYSEAIITLQLLSIALGFAIIGGIVTNCINIPTGNEDINLKGTLIAAVMNISLNLFMIPIWKQNGAAITTVIAEFIVIVYCWIKNKEMLSFFNWKTVRVSAIHAIVGCVIVVAVTTIVYAIIDNWIIACFLVFFLSVLLYGAFLVFINDKLAREVFEKISRRILKYIDK